VRVSTDLTETAVLVSAKSNAGGNEQRLHGLRSGEIVHISLVTSEDRLERELLHVYS
jgi:hypothetical protein